MINAMHLYIFFPVIQKQFANVALSTQGISTDMFYLHKAIQPCFTDSSVIRHLLSQSSLTEACGRSCLSGSQIAFLFTTFQKYIKDLLMRK